MTARLKLSLTRGQAVALHLEATHHAVVAVDDRDHATWRAIEREAQRVLAYDDERTSGQGGRRGERVDRRLQRSSQLSLFEGAGTDAETSS